MYRFSFFPPYAELGQGAPVKTSAIGFLFREMHQRGLRVRGGHMKMDKIPEDVNLVLWDLPNGEKLPVAWWMFEHKVGEEYDKVKRIVKGEKTWVDITIELFHPGYKEQAGTLLDVLESPRTRYVFDMGVIAELRDNNPGGFLRSLDRREWLECDKCGVTDYNLKKYGPATANRQCRMTPHCTGKIRRLPPIFEVTSPKTVPKRRPKAGVAEMPSDSERITRQVITAMEEFLGNDAGSVDREIV